MILIFLRSYILRTFPRSQRRRVNGASTFPKRKKKHLADRRIKGKIEEMIRNLTTGRTSEEPPGECLVKTSMRSKYTLKRELLDSILTDIYNTKPAGQSLSHLTNKPVKTVGHSQELTRFDKEGSRDEMVVLKKYEIDANMELEKKRIEMEGIAKIAEQGPNSLNGFQLQFHTHTHAHDAANNSSHP